MPQSSTIQTQMKTHLGVLPRLDANEVIDNISYKRNVVAKVSAYTVKASESGTLFTTEGATADVNFTLPTNADGLEFWFFNMEDIEMKVTADVADTLVVFGDVAADSIAFSAATGQIGNGFVCIADGSKWAVFQIAGNGGSLPSAATIVTD